VVNSTKSSVEEVTQTAATVDAAIGPALEQGVIPVINVVADIAVALSGVRLSSGVLGTQC